MTELALERWRSGYRRILLLLRREVLHVNHKRVYRLHHPSGLGGGKHKAAFADIDGSFLSSPLANVISPAGMPAF